MLKRIAVRGYKSLRDLDVELRPLSVLFGPNAAGKSNFLDVLQLLSRIATARNLKEAFGTPHRGEPLESFSFGKEGIKGLLTQRSASFTIEADMELSPAVARAVDRQIREMRTRKLEPEENAPPHGDPDERKVLTWPYLRYRITVEIIPKKGFLRVIDEYLSALRKDGEPTKSPMPFIEKVEGKLHLRMEGQAHPRYYDTGIDHSLLSLPLYPPHYPHVTALKKELESWLFFYFEPRVRMRAANPVKEVRHIGAMGEQLAAYLHTLRATDEAQFRSIEKALKMIVPSITGIIVEPNDLGEVELKLLEEQTPIPARVVSEGTLRILGLLASKCVNQPPALIGLEEPENGVHPRRIGMIAELLESRESEGDTQMIVTTHSPILPDKLRDDSLYVCRKECGGTQISPFRTWGPLGRTEDIQEALDEDRRPVSQRIVRGDFDA